MAPKKILEKRAEIKDLEKTEKAKSFQKQSKYAFKRDFNFR